MNFGEVQHWAMVGTDLPWAQRSVPWWLVVRVPPLDCQILGGKTYLFSVDIVCVWSPIHSTPLWNTEVTWLIPKPNNKAYCCKRSHLHLPWVIIPPPPYGVIAPPGPMNRLLPWHQTSHTTRLVWSDYTQLFNWLCLKSTSGQCLWGTGVFVILSMSVHLSQYAYHDECGLV